MRLIDADALKDSLPEPEPNNNGEQWTHRVLCDFIDNAPTVESDYEWGYSEGVHDTERPQGEWIYNQYDGNPSIGNWHCSNCNNICAEMRLAKDNFNYCPNCGAKMQKGGAEK